MVRLSASTNSSTLKTLIFDRLKEYVISEHNLTFFTTDGASIREKIGRESKCLKQICHSHGIHLVGSYVLYNKCEASHMIELDTDDTDGSVELLKSIQEPVTGEVGAYPNNDIYPIILKLR